MLDLVPPAWFYLMILIDALIAFVIPIYVWWKQIKKRVVELTETLYPVVNGVYDKMKPKFKEDIKSMANELMVQFKTDMQTTIHNNINVIRGDIKTAVTNDIPHMIEEQMEPIRANLARVFSKTGVAAKSEKAQERLNKEMAIIATDPSKAKMIQGLGFARKKIGMSASDYDTVLDIMLLQAEGSKNNDKTESRESIRAEGGSSDLGQAPETEEGSQAKSAEVVPVTKKQIENRLSALGIDPKNPLVQDKIEKGIDAQNNKLAPAKGEIASLEGKGMQIGKEKEEKQREEQEHRSNADDSNGEST